MSDGGSELLRPEPPRTWRDRVDALTAWTSGRPWPAVLAALAGVVAVAIAAVAVLRPPAAAAPPAEVWLPRATAGGAAGAGSTTTVPAPVVVHVAGAVVRPGLVRLGGGARVADAVDAAGGLRPDADLDRLNLAAPVADGQRVWVPVIGRQPPAEIGPDGGAVAPDASAPGATGDVVDLNTATAADLETLPGVGPATAQAILDHRRRIGRFRAVDELLDVRGIGPSKLAALRDRVRV